MAKHEAPDERTITITLTGPLERDDGERWLAEDTQDSDLCAHGNTPGHALRRLGRKLDRQLAAKGWKGEGA